MLNLVFYLIVGSIGLVGLIYSFSQWAGTCKLHPFYFVISSGSFLRVVKDLCILYLLLDGLFLWSLPRKGGVLGFAIAYSNTFGLVTWVFLLGFGLSEIPWSLLKNADYTVRQKLLSHKTKIPTKLDEAHQNFSNAIVVSYVELVAK